MTYLRSICLAGLSAALCAAPQAGFAFWFLPSFSNSDLRDARAEVFSGASPETPEISIRGGGDSNSEGESGEAIEIEGNGAPTIAIVQSDENLNSAGASANSDTLASSSENAAAPVEGAQDTQSSFSDPLETVTILAARSQPSPQPVANLAQPISAFELDRVMPGESFDLGYELSDGLTQPALSTFPIKVFLEVEAGDTLSTMFNEVGISIVETQVAGRALGEVFNLGSLRPGQIIELELNGAVAPMSPNRLQRISLAPTNLEVVEVVRRGDAFESSISTIELQRILVHARGSLLTGSIFTDGTAMGIEGSILANYVNALDAQVNFSRIQSVGDGIEMIYEAYFDDEGRLVDAGDVLYASYEDQSGDNYEAFRFETQGKAAYFTRDARFTGQTNTLMRKPLGGGRLSSRFGWRIHPVYGDRRMHNGVDYAASCGTPIYAAGDGVITFAGWKGGYGKFIAVKHGATYTTNYAHLRSFANGMRPGARVRKGQLIGRVGTTGVSTGCHLHYEVVKNGTRINPLSDHIPRGDDLARAARTRFLAFVGQIDAEREQEITLDRALARARSGG